MFDQAVDTIRAASPSDDRGPRDRSGRLTTPQPGMEVIAILDKATADQAAGILMDRSIWFAIDPLSDGRWAILVKTDAAHQVRSMLMGGDPVTDWHQRKAS